MTFPQSPGQPGIYRQRPLSRPEGATELILVRHGQSEAYVEGSPFPLTGGHGDPPLSVRGHEQARRVCDRLATLADGDLGAIYVSTLRRTAQTAAPLAERLGIAPRVDADLREVYLGEWEAGQYRKMVAEQHPVAMRMFATERWDVIPGAESTEAFADRVRTSVRRIAVAHRDARVAVFTHGGVIGQLLAMATSARPFAFTGADNASISRVFIAGDQWIIRGYNDTAHLDGLEPGVG